MAKLEDVPVSSQNTAAETQEELLDRLDELWKNYLGLLDQYQAAQAELATYLSSVCTGQFDQLCLICSNLYSRVY
jgi:hypothetical protein